MSAPFNVKGWCPGAWRPMETGDGWLVRVRPPLGELTRAQALALAQAADRFGSGLIELTRRANLQLRGVSEHSWPALMAFLVEHGLAPPSALDERRPPLTLSPEWQEGDDTHRAARRLEESDFPALPAKVGIAVDAGPTPVLGDAPADFRIERDDTGALLVRCEGRALGTRVESAEAAADLVVKLCRWFMESGGGQARRMGRHRAPLPAWARQDAAPTALCQALALGAHPLGAVVGLSLGRVEAASLRALVTPFEDCRLRVTPWRRLLVTGADVGRLPALPGVMTESSDPRLSMDACPGAPFCGQASVDTRAMAARLARHRASSLHVSGCAKGCARSRPAAVCLTGRGGRFDVLINDRADGEPAARGLTEPDVLDYLEKLGALHL